MIDAGTVYFTSSIGLEIIAAVKRLSFLAKFGDGAGALPWINKVCVDFVLHSSSWSHRIRHSVMKPLKCVGYSKHGVNTISTISISIMNPSMPCKPHHLRASIRLGNGNGLFHYD